MGKDVYNITFYGSHNSSYVVEKNGEIVLVLEVERFLNYKNSGMAQYLCPKVPDLLFLAKYIPKFIMKKFGIEKFHTCTALNSDVIIDKSYFLEKYIPAEHYQYTHHHLSHAAGAFYQSPFNEAIIFSSDGGGDDGFFNIYQCKRGESPILLERVLNAEGRDLDLGFPYMILAHYMEDIKFEDLGMGNLVYPGKLMGLTAYGTVREEWLDDFKSFYFHKIDGLNYEEKVKNLGDKIGVEFNIENRLKGQLAYDVAATTQRAFEETFLDVVKPYFENYKTKSFCVTGGCGLNILLNTRMVEEFGIELFVPPDPNDCGIGLGMMLNILKPDEPFDSTYSGLELLDTNMLGHFIQEESLSFTTTILDNDKLVKDLINGKIVGVARGRSEHGPRALGNRSILCNPATPDMKDILNHKVKHREWYRPFAPVVRLEDVGKYFEWDKESRWMSFCPKVRKEWQDKLEAITHIDGTARVQTVTKEQHEWLYDLLTKLDEESGIGVLLNTSFNVQGKPILSSIKDAFKIFKESQMDSLIIEDYYLKKN